MSCLILVQGFPMGLTPADWCFCWWDFKWDSVVKQRSCYKPLPYKQSCMHENTHSCSDTHGKMWEHTHTYTCMHIQRSARRVGGRDGEIRMKRAKMNSRIISLISQDLTEICGWDGWSPWKNRAYSQPPAPHSPIPPNPLPVPPFKRDYGERQSERERVRASLWLVVKSPSFPRNPLWEVSEESVKEKNTGF